MVKDKLLVISPCRNEAAFMRRTLDSMIHQSVIPERWVIVDDGSTDKTAEILAEYSAKFNFIKIVTCPNRGKRSVGPGVIEAYYSGYKAVQAEKYDYICKLDLDLELPPRYFEILLNRMEDNPRIGTSSGKPYFVDKRTGKLVSEKCGDENSVGASKLFRKKCFDQIGGFVPQVMWDAIDGHRCRMLGWIAISWDEPELRFLHLRPMGSSQKSIMAGRMRHGFGQYFMGTDILYMTASAIYRMGRPPYILGGLGMWWGYMKSMISRQKRLDDPGFRNFLRSFHLSCLLNGKPKAIEKLNRQCAKFWMPKATKSIFQNKN